MIAHDPSLPADATLQGMVEGNPLGSPCRQSGILKLEGHDTSEQIWTENLEEVKGLVETAERQDLPAGLSLFTLVIRMDPNEDRNAGSGAMGCEATRSPFDEGVSGIGKSRVLNGSYWCISNINGRH